MVLHDEPGVSAFQGKVVVLTGASQGIGREMALQLADRGARLVLAARSHDKLEQVAQKCRDRGAETTAVPTDITDRLACEMLIRRAVADFDGIDVLINNAGISVVARFGDLEAMDLPEQVMKVNYLGSVYCTYYGLPYLRRAKGRIVAVASLTGRTGVPLRSIYAASKHAMVGFFESLRIEEKLHGVSVTIALPDFVQTEVRERVLGPRGTPLAFDGGSSRFMTAERCAELILRAAAKRKREIVMSGRGKLGKWIKVIAPGAVDRMAERAMRQVKYEDSR